MVEVGYVPWVEKEGDPASGRRCENACSSWHRLCDRI